MNSAEVDQLRINIESRVRNEIAWQRCLEDPRGQLPEHQAVLERLEKSRRRLSNQLERIRSKQLRIERLRKEEVHSVTQTLKGNT